MKHFTDLQNALYGFSNGHLLLQFQTPTMYVCNFIKLQATTG